MRVLETTVEDLTKGYLAAGGDDKPRPGAGWGQTWPKNCSGCERA